MVTELIWKIACACSSIDNDFYDTLPDELKELKEENTKKI